MNIKLKGKDASDFIAALMVDQYGSDALNKCVGPMREAVYDELERREKAPHQTGEGESK